jgi:outer membrane protein OmpA-like peptidoglycan-associated protein
MDGIRIPSDALFAFDSDVIAWKAQSALIDAGAFITEKRKERLKDGGRFKIMVVGHTDNIGSDEYNVGLSERRANAVAKWLINKQYLPANEIHTYGEGETKPIEPNQRPSDGKDNPYGREKNRRVEIIIM